MRPCTTRSSGNAALIVQHRHRYPVGLMALNYNYKPHETGAILLERVPQSPCSLMVAVRFD